MTWILKAALFLALTTGMAAYADDAKPETVLFVCQFGSVKSAITRELFRRRAAELGVPVRAISRGITPEMHIDADLRERLAAEGIDPARDPLTPLDASSLEGADIVVFFDRLPEALTRGDARDWTDIPSMTRAYPETRVMLDSRIDALIEEVRGRKRQD